jgi:NAD(P)H-flavin reductase
MDWFEATLVSRRVVAGTVQVDVPETVKASFTAPGQYLMVRVADVHGPFAPASAPRTAGPLELLFKPGTPLTDALERLPQGGRLQVSQAGGSGFPLEKAKGRPLLLVAVGTGQAPMRSVIESIRRDRAAFGPVTLLLGVRDADHLAFSSDEAAWAKDGIVVHVTLTAGGAAWKGRIGRVQLHLPNGDLRETIAFIVGQRAMVEDVVTELHRRGMPRGHIFLNV